MIAALSAEHLGHRYAKHRWALRDCTLSVPAGRVAALVGPNGSGKTTLLNIAAGLLQPSAGRVLISGESPQSHLPRIGYVAQDAPLWPRMRVSDVLEIGNCMNSRFDKARAGQRMAEFDVPLRARVNTLSGGQRAQVALTIVLAKRPDLLLLDEPLANLDPLARREFLTSMFTACADSGIAVLFSSHSVAELERICDYLIVLRAGQVQVVGDVDDLRAAHRVVTGPHGWHDDSPFPVISATRIGSRSVALVAKSASALTGPGFDESSPTFNELTLGYLAAGAPQPAQAPA